MTTLALSFAAVFLSLTQTNDYLFTRFDSSNVVKSIKGYGSSTYAIPRVEDMAFLHEASLERDLSAKSFNVTNAYTTRPTPLFNTVTNMARFGQYGPFGSLINLTSIQRNWFKTNCYEISDVHDSLFSSTNLNHLINGLTLINDGRTNHVYHEAMLSWIRTGEFDQRAGYEGHQYNWWTHTNGYSYVKMNFSRNFKALYNNLKAAEIIQDIKTPYHATGGTYKRRELRDAKEFRIWSEGGETYWKEFPDKYDRDVDNGEFKVSDGFRTHREYAVINLTRYSRVGVPDDALGHSFDYTCWHKQDPQAEYAYFNIAIVTNRSDQSPKLAQGYEVVKSFALAEATVSERWKSTNYVHRTTYWAYPIEVVDQKKDGTVTVRIGLSDAASNILRAMGYEELEKSGPILQEMAGGHPDASPEHITRSNTAEIEYMLSILNLTSVIRMKWRSRWFETEEERDREIQ